jgi:hypothetical protein
VTDEAAVKFLKGGWLEGVLFNRIRRRFAGNDRVAVSANLGLAHRDAAGSRGPRIAEIDIAILVKSQLHLVEAKTASMTTAAAKAGGQVSLAQIDSVKKLLVGQIGKVLIANPREDAASVGKHGGDIHERARRGGEELFVGADAVDAVVRRAVDIVDAA